MANYANYKEAFDMYPIKQENERIIFDSAFKTFRLYPGDSLYAFSISPELSLEHLYWGKKLPPGYDLRYLSQSSRMSHFNTAELYDSVTNDAVRDSLFTDLQWVSVESLRDTWRKNKNSNVIDSSDSDAVNQRRLENLSWRLMSKLSSCSVASTESERECIDIAPNEECGPLSISIEDNQNPFYESLTRSFTPLKPANSKLPLFTEDPLQSEPKSILRKPKQTSTSLLTSSATPRINMKTPRGQTNFNNQKRVNISQRAFERQGGQISKGILNVEYSDHGTGDFRQPSFVVLDTFNGSSISPLRYRRHSIYKGKKEMPEHMPGLRFLNADTTSTLVITMADQGSGLEVDLIYVVPHDYDAISRRAVFRNVDNRSTYNSSKSEPDRKNFIGAIKIVERASSLTIDFESTPEPFYIVQLSGSWGRERQIVETKLTHGIQAFGSTKGVSGHQHNPFAALTFGPPNESKGEVKGFSLIYSGNFLFEAELTEMGRLRINMGINPMGFQWHLQQGETFNTPEAVLVRSCEGLGGMSRMFHRLFNNHLIAPLPIWAQLTPPVLLNTWEAKYFDVDHPCVVEMAKQASKIGIDVIVVDDGWFGNRDDDTSSLGDWSPNKTKFPLGFGALSKDINSYGCRLGVWFEPEMISEQSRIFIEHPDWYLHVPGRPRQVGRNQMVLDLTRQEVRDYIFETMKKVITEGRIDYLKWDMNRPLTEVFSQRNPVWQSETSYRYVLGLYELQSRIVKEYPDLLFENCASGGGRFDPGMLYYSPQIWCSDNTDALIRIQIQYGTSLVYPASCVGAHVSCVPNHITGNTTRARTRGFVAMCGTFGFELDFKEVSTKDKALFREQIAIFRALSPIIRSGDLYRLWDPFQIKFAAWMYVTYDKSNAVVFAFSFNSFHWSNLVPRLTLQGLDPDAEYEVTEPLPNNIIQNIGNLKIIESETPIYQLGFPVVVLTGSILMDAGLPIKFYTLDDSVMFFINKTSCKTPQSRDWQYIS